MGEVFKAARRVSIFSLSENRGRALLENKLLKIQPAVSSGIQLDFDDNGIYTNASHCDLRNAP
ncbi:hypothetical protein KJ068_27365 [bacterium]|nr:hypothetical protein [bacterium]